MSIIIELLEILAALAVAFAIAFGVYGIISTIFKHKAVKEMEELMRRKRNGDFYDDDDYCDYEDVY